MYTSFDMCIHMNSIYHMYESKDSEIRVHISYKFGRYTFLGKQFYSTSIHSLTKYQDSLEKQ